MSKIGNSFGVNFESNCGNLVNQFGSSKEFVGDYLIRSLPVVESLVLDGEKGELVNSSGKVVKNNVDSKEKTMAALKSHSEAERRRRERINAHFATLRGLVPSNEKMDKAALLSEVITQLKQLKKTATQASEGLHLPMDTDEVKVEKIDGTNIFMMRASICCEFNPDLLSDLRKAISNLPLRQLKCEISTLRGRVKILFLLTPDEEEKSYYSVEARETVMSSVRLALSNVLDKVLASAEYGQELFFPRKRQRVSYSDSS